MVPTSASILQGNSSFHLKPPSRHRQLRGRENRDLLSKQVSLACLQPIYTAKIKPLILDNSTHSTPTIRQVGFLLTHRPRIFFAQVTQTFSFPTALKFRLPVSQNVDCGYTRGNRFITCNHSHNHRHPSPKLPNSVSSKFLTSPLQ